MNLKKNRFNKFFLLTMIASIIVLLSILNGCRTTINGAADELKASLWYGEFENGTSISLAFSGTSAEIKINTTGKLGEQTISGSCVFRDNEFVITDEKMGEAIHVNFKLTGKTVELIYLGQTVALNKV